VETVTRLPFMVGYPFVEPGLLPIGEGEQRRATSRWLKSGENPGHAPFAFTFPEPAACLPQRIRSFGNGDDEKRHCFAASELQTPGCVVFSIGSNNAFGFETAVAAETKCHIHVFDCTTRTPRVPRELVERVTFYGLCLGGGGMHKSYAELVEISGGRPPEYLQIDVEGHEWESLVEMVQNSLDLLPKQLSVEFHLAYLPWSVGFLGANEVEAFFNRMWEVGGFAVADVRNNPACSWCAELLLVRA
jgi:hypothetical protein